MRKSWKMRSTQRSEIQNEASVYSDTVYRFTVLLQTNNSSFALLNSCEKTGKRKLGKYYRFFYLSSIFNYLKHLSGPTLRLGTYCMGNALPHTQRDQFPKGKRHYVDNEIVQCILITFDESEMLFQFVQQILVASNC